MERRKITKEDIENHNKVIGYYCLPPDGIRTRRRSKIKWRNVIPALVAGSVIAFVIWHVIAALCALAKVTMNVPVCACVDLVVFLVASAVASTCLNAVHRGKTRP